MSLNRRRTPRLVKGLAVDIINMKGEKFSLLTLNISCYGFGIQCSTIERNQLTPQGDFVDMGKPVEFDVTLKLPGERGQTESISGRCRVLYSRRVANNICEMGMRYIDIEGNDEDKLVGFIQKESSIK